MTVYRCAVVCGVVAGLAACGHERATAPIEAPAGPARIVGLPEGWGGGGSAYTIGIDKTNKRSGTAAAFLTANNSSPTGFATITQGLAADSFRARRVRWSGWVRHAGISNGGLWMRIDGPSLTLGFDDMSTRALSGTADWHQVAVVLDVPANAIGFSFGVLLSGPGDLLVDDLRLEVVGNDVPTTDMLSAPTPSTLDSASLAASYARQVRVMNLDFEGIHALAAATIDWLRTTSVPLASVSPGTGFTDLEPLRQMVGSARVVGLGEGTHGTREFFLLKHRLLEFLVSEMGFTHFAIEATWPESNDVNRYVLTGEGDPAKLLANLYFWTWNTQEVLDLIKWMRRWNETALADRRVQFVGFDMQFPGAAMDTVTEFVQRVDPTSLSYVGGRYACLALYRNHGRVFIRSAAQYGALSAPQKDACKTGLHEVLAFIDDRQASFEAASSRAKYSNVRQSARLVQQFEEMASSSSTASLVRDKAMAENTQWLLDQAGPSARMVLWAHNYHVSNLPTSMGGYLRRTWGASYVNLGFLFGSGSFNAYGVNAPLREWSSALVPAWSLEAAFLATARPIALFDARTVLTGGAPGEPLRGPIPMRSVGAFFDQTRESAYYGSTVLPGDFDLLLFVATTSASSLLPFP